MLYRCLVFLLSFFDLSHTPFLILPFTASLQSSPFFCEFSFNAPVIVVVGGLQCS
uniref:Uncharacterized protein n=1 Tax=Parascaris univalens TaxID=6257 RepID=A0A915AT14_PARUN